MAFKPAKLRGLRNRYGWTQQQLAVRLGVDAATVSRWERGRSSPRSAVRETLETMYTAGGAATVQAPMPLDPGIDELVRTIGLERARMTLRRQALLDRAPSRIEFPVDPGTRLRELEAALKDQTDLNSRAKIG